MSADRPRGAGPLGALAGWLGGWWRLALLALAAAAVGGGLLWEQWRHPPAPEGAAQVVTSLNANIRQTSFRYAGPLSELRAFYQRELPRRGWRYCGTQAEPGCTNLTRLATRSDQAIDVYRRPDDRDQRGPTVEVWPIERDGAQLYVTLYETQGQ